MLTSKESRLYCVYLSQWMDALVTVQSHIKSDVCCWEWTCDLCRMVRQRCLSGLNLISLIHDIDISEVIYLILLYKWSYYLEEREGEIQYCWLCCICLWQQTKIEIEKSKYTAASGRWWHTSTQVPWKLCFSAHYCSSIHRSFYILTSQIYFRCWREESLWAIDCYSATTFKMYWNLVWGKI